MATKGESSPAASANPLAFAAVGVAVLPFVLPLRYFLALLALVAVGLYLTPLAKSSRSKEEAACSTHVGGNEQIGIQQASTETSKTAPDLPNKADAPFSSPAAALAPADTTLSAADGIGREDPPAIADSAAVPTNKRGTAQSDSDPADGAASDKQTSLPAPAGPQPAALPPFVPKAPAQASSNTGPAAAGGAAILARLRSVFLVDTGI